MEDVNLEHLKPEQRSKVRDFLRPLATKWSGILGTVTMASHKIDIDPDARPFRSQLYRAGLMEREIQRYEVQRQLKRGVIKPCSSECASPFLLDSKIDGTKNLR